MSLRSSEPRLLQNELANSISAFNAASLRAHARLGARRLGSATFLRCGRWQWMLATRPPYFHLSRHAAAFPRLRRS